MVIPYKSSSLDKESDLESLLDNYIKKGLLFYSTGLIYLS